MAWTSDSKVLDNVASTQVPLHHAVPPFPFNAALFPPKGIVFAEPIPFLEKLEAARLKELEEAAKGVPSEVTLAENTLIEVATKGVIETAKVRAAQLILERYDSRTIIAQLQAEIEALKVSAQAKDDEGELPPNRRRGR